MFYIENLVIRSEPFPDVGTTSSPNIATSEENVSEANKTLSGDTAELSTAVAKESVNSNEGKKSSPEKKTSDDSDDPFGALDWKDGIATLPGNAPINLKHQHPPPPLRANSRPLGPKLHSITPP